MFLQRLIRPGAEKAAAQRLYAATVERARAPDLYAALGAPDTPDGRFELYTLFVLLVLERLRAEGKDASAKEGRAKDGGAFAQTYFDVYLSGLDHGLRELAVGDLTVPKTMRRLGEAFYGRGKALDEALAALPDRAPLAALVARTVFDGDETADPNPLAARILKERAALSTVRFDDLAQGVMGLAPA